MQPFDISTPPKHLLEFNKFDKYPIIRTGFFLASSPKGGEGGCYKSQTGIGTTFEKSPILQHELKNLLKLDLYDKTHLQIY